MEKCFWNKCVLKRIKLLLFSSLHSGFKCEVTRKKLVKFASQANLQTENESQSKDKDAVRLSACR